MKRRAAVRDMALLLGGAISATTLSALFEGCSPSAERKGADQLFTEDQNGLITEISDTIIPKTDTPGANEAGVGAFISMMIAECYDEDTQKRFVKGLEEVEELSDSKFSKSFIALEPQQRHTVLREIADNTLKLKEEDEKKEDADKSTTSEPKKRKTYFFQLIRELTLLGYYTSEIGATQALAYLPIPGRYDGCTDLKEGQKTWAL